MAEEQQCTCYEQAGDNPQCAVDHTTQAHKERYFELQKILVELLEDYSRKTGKHPSNTTALELLQWAYRQTKEPTP